MTVFSLSAPGLCFLAPSARAQEAPPPPPAETAARRAQVRNELEKVPGKRAALLLRSPSPARFAGDVDYPYRPDNNLYYLSGIAREGAALLISASEIEGVGREVLFLPPPSPLEGRWITRRLTAPQASARSGLPEKCILPLEQLPGTLEKALGLSGGHHRTSNQPLPRLYFEGGRDSRPGEPLSGGYAFLLSRLGSAAFHLDLEPPSRLMAPLRQVKSQSELELLKSAIAITCEAQLSALRALRPGVFEYQLAAVIEHEFRARGASGWAFPSIVGSGPNTCILHYDRYDRRIAEGDLVLMDIGAEYGFYAADVTRTVPASGQFTDRQRQVYQIVYDAQEAAFRAIRPGLPFADVHRIASEVVAAGLIGLGLIENPSQVGKYFTHSTSHGLGLDVHDPMPISTLAEGMVITVEPGIYIPDEGLGVRIEDDVLVTAAGCQVLSTGAPRAPEEVERWMRARSF